MSNCNFKSSISFKNILVEEFSDIFYSYYLCFIHLDNVKIKKYNIYLTKRYHAIIMFIEYKREKGHIESDEALSSSPR